MRTVRSDLEKEISLEKKILKIYVSPILGSLAGHCAEHNHLRGGQVVQVVDVNLDISGISFDQAGLGKVAQHIKSTQKGIAATS